MLGFDTIAFDDAAVGEGGVRGGAAEVADVALALLELQAVRA